MKRGPSLIATFVMSAIAPLLLAQNEQPTLPSDILGPRLIMWSQQQEPQPLLQTPASVPSHRQPELRTFTGRMIKGRAGYLLQQSLSGSSDVIYQLDNNQSDNQGLWEHYEGKEVVLTGTLDDSGRGIQVTGIHLRS
jgi:hypothetical protein